MVNTLTLSLMIDSAKVRILFLATKFFGNYSRIIFEMLKCKILFLYQVVSNQQSVRFDRAIL